MIGKRHRQDFVVGVRLQPRRTPGGPSGSARRARAVDASPGSSREHLYDLRVRGTGETLVRVSESVDEHQQVTIAHLRHPLVQLREVGLAVVEGSDHVCPRSTAK